MADRTVHMSIRCAGQKIDLDGESERLHRMLDAADADGKVVEMGGRDGKSQ